MSFLSTLPPHGSARDAVILGAIATGNLDTPEWIPVVCGRVKLRVSADYLKIQGARVPMSAPVAQAAVGSLDAVLPTRKVVEAIEAAARIVAMPVWPGADKLSSPRLAWCEEQTGTLSGLVAGHRKDVVVCKAMAGRPGRVWIFGARWGNGKRIQPLSGVHEASYADLSHGVRAVLDACEVDGQPALVSELYRDDTLSAWLSDEGPLPVVRYPLAAGMAAPHSAVTPSQDQPGGSHVTATPAPSTSAPAARNPSPAAPFTLPTTAILRRGHRGEAVRELQRLLAAAGYVLARDGLYGPATEAAVREYQEERGLAASGVADAETMASLRGRVVGEVADTDPGVLPGVLSDAEVDALFGPLEWVHAPTTAEPGGVRITNGWTKDNLRRVVIPQLRGVEGAPADGGVYLHRLIAEQTRALFAAWEAAGLLPLVRTWAGSWNPRLVRGGSTLSRHSYATSFDINAAWNGLGKPAAPRGAIGSVVPLVPLAVAHGYTWGGRWNRPDAMHFEGVRVL